MHKPFPFASLVHPAGAHLPALELDISAQYQYCVNAGATAACVFLENRHSLLLHDHVASALRSFDLSVTAGVAAAGAYDTATMRACTDAFTAGYLGRLQQELMRLAKRGAA